MNSKSRVSRTSANTPAANDSTLLRWLPIILFIALGSHLHRVHGSDGILGIPFGLMLISQVLVTVRRPVDSLSPVGTFVVRWKRTFIALGALAVVGGTLDAAGIR